MWIVFFCLAISVISSGAEAVYMLTCLYISTVGNIKVYDIFFVVVYNNSLILRIVHKTIILIKK